MSVYEYIQNASVGLPAAVTPVDKVYKDDCMYSFDTAENNTLGIDVCMTCFQSFARTEYRDWTAAHYTQKRHAVFLNIVKVLIPESKRQSLFRPLLTDSRVPKAPKLEIVQQTDLDLYTTTTQIYVALLDRTLELNASPEPVQALAAQILNTNSANTNNDITAWEHEIFACEHSLALSQVDEVANVKAIVFSGLPVGENSAVSDDSYVARKGADSVDAGAENIVGDTHSPQNILQCSGCELTLNLWICLTCGTISCGRENFGSDIKGNSHALAHFDACGHPVAAKLGSLSADEDKCDCYCYKCNDEVKVPHLGRILQRFGIDLAMAVKSEKTLVEMNVETNRKWQFNLEGSDGEILAPVLGPGLTGMQNLGNSCYLNSVVQALFSLAAYRDYFAQMSFDFSVENPAQDLASQLLKLYDGLISGRYSRPSSLKGVQYQEGIRPHTFKNLVGANHAEFRTNKQQDASEFLTYLLDMIDKELGLSVNRDLKFVYSSKLVCTGCNNGSTARELVDTVALPLHVAEIGTEDGKKIYASTTLDKSLQMLTHPEIIEGYQCEACGQRTEAHKQGGFETFPKYLLASLQRIQLENWAPVKVGVSVEIPDRVDLAAYRAPEFADNETEIIKEKPAAGHFKPNAEALSTLQSMGFSENRSCRALYHTGNKDAETAMNWIFGHMEEAEIDAPFAFPADETTSSLVLQEAIDNLVSMGFPAKVAKKALLLSLGDVNSALEWLFSHPDDDGKHAEQPFKINVQEESRQLQQALLDEASASPVPTANYRVKAVVCHKGSSPHTGHYVVFVKKDGRWVLFNDEKVVDCGESIDEIRTSSYIYVLEKI